MGLTRVWNDMSFMIKEYKGSLREQAENIIRYSECS